MNIPKRIGHIWVGPNPPPIKWMESWKDNHPDWEYVLYDNEYLQQEEFINQTLIDFYWNLGLYAGVADLMRYEILYKHGGFIPEADSYCYHNTDELFNSSPIYTVYENELLRGKLASPILASQPNNKFLEQIITELSTLTIDQLDTPWRTTGNLFIAEMIEKYQPDIKIFPSHYFIPVHHEGIIYKGNDKIYCKQMFGSTFSSYAKSGKTNIISIFKDNLKNFQQKYQRKAFSRICKKRRMKNFSQDFDR